MDAGGNDQERLRAFGAQVAQQVVDNFEQGGGRFQALPTGLDSIAPKKFNGSILMPFDIWVNDFEGFCTAANYSDAQKLAVFPRYLTGQAKVKYNDTLRSANPPQTLNAWKVMFTATFPSSRGIMFRREQLKNMRMPEDGQTVEAFSEKVRQVSLLAYPENSDQREDEAKTRFILGLFPDIRKSIMDPGEIAPSSFEIALERALNTEMSICREQGNNPFNFLYQQPKTPGSGGQPTTTISAVNEVQTENSLLRSEVSDLRKRLQAVEVGSVNFQRGRAPARTFNRGGYYRGGGYSYGGRRGSNSASWVPICNHCGRPGHVQRNCIDYNSQFQQFQQQPRYQRGYYPRRGGRARGGRRFFRRGYTSAAVVSMPVSSAEDEQSMSHQEEDEFNAFEGYDRFSPSRAVVACVTSKVESSQEQEPSVQKSENDVKGATKGKKASKGAKVEVATKKVEKPPASRECKRAQKKKVHNSKLSEGKNEFQSRGLLQGSRTVMVQVLGSVSGTFLGIAAPMAKILLQAVILFSMVRFAGTVSETKESQKYFSCSQARDGFLVSIPDMIRCEAPALKNVSEFATAMVELFVPRQNPIVHSAFKCSLKSQKVCTKVGFFGAKVKTVDKVENRVITPHECVRARDDLSYKGDKLTNISNTMFATQNKMEVHFQYCCKERCFETTNLFIEDGTVATFDGQVMSSDIALTGGCHPTAGRCLTESQALIWEPFPFEKVCPFESKGTYEAQVMDNTLIIDSLVLPLTLTRDTLSDCLPDLVRTEEGFGIVFTAKYLPKFLKGAFKNRAKRSSLSDIMYFSRYWDDMQLDRARKGTRFDVIKTASDFISIRVSKSNDTTTQRLDYLEFKILQLEFTKYRQMWRASCESYNRNLHLVQAMLQQVDVTAGARILLQRHDIAAVFVGDALLVYPCELVQVFHVYYSYEYSGKCYAHMPIDTSEGIKFLVPGTREVISYSHELPCDNRFPGVQRVPQGWVSENGPIHVQSAVSSKPFLGEPNVFVRNQIAKSQYEFQRLRDLSSRVPMITAAMDRLVSYTAELSNWPAEVARSVFSEFRNVNSLSLIAANATSQNHVPVSLLLRGKVKLALSALWIMLLLALVVVTITCLVRRCRISCPRLHFGWFKRRHERDDDDNPNCVMLRHSHRVDPIRSLAEALQRFINGSSAQSPTPQYQPPPIYPLLSPDSAEKTTQKQQPKPEVSAKTMGVLVAIVGACLQHPVTKIRLNGQVTETLLDSGSLPNIMDEAEYRKSPTPLVDSDAIAVTVDGIPLSTVGETFRNISFGKVKVKAPFLVVKDLQFPALLGLQFMRQYPQTVFNWNENSCVLAGHVLPLKPGKNSEQKRSSSIAYVSDNVMIPPRSEALIRVATKYPVGKSPVLFEPSRLFSSKTGLVCGAALVDGNNVVLSALNLGANPIPVYANMTVGLVSVIPPKLIIGKVGEANQDRQSSNDDREFAEFIRTNVDLSHIKDPVQRERVFQLLQGYPKLFSRSLSDIGTCDVVEHEIPLKEGSVPLSFKPYRVAQSERAQMDNHTSNMLGAKVIRPSQSPWSASAFLVGKADGSTRFVTDFRGINDLTIKQFYPLPRLDDMLSVIGKPMYITALDQRWGYYQIPVKPEDIPKTAFSTYDGHYEYLKLPMGMSGSAATFQRAMNLILSGLTWKKVLVYLDDTIIISSSFENHLCDIREVFDRLQSVGIKLRADKCFFFQAKLKFLGHIISSEGIQPNPGKLKQIKELPEPKNKTQVQSFLGVTNFFRRFVKNYAAIAGPLVELTKTGVTFKFDDRRKQAFQTLKDCLTNAPVLKSPEYNKPFYLATDASQTAIGGVLMQESEDGILQPIGYASKQLTPVQQRYPTIEREAYAVKEFLRHFKYIMYQHELHLLTDHKPLAQILRGSPKSEPASSRLLTWALKFQDYPMTVHYLPGKLNVVADFLSRLPSSVNDIQSAEVVGAIQGLDDEKVEANDDATIEDAQRIDPETSHLHHYLSSGQLPVESRLAQDVIALANSHTVIGNTLMQFEPKNPENFRIVVPSKFRKRILEEHHDCQGHFGITLTYKRLAEKYVWRNMMKDVDQYVRQCDVCQRIKPLPRSINPSITSIVPPKEPFAFVGMDIWSSGIRSFSGMQYMLVITDYLTRFAVAVALERQDAKSVAKALLNNVILVHGPPTHFFSDKGGSFLNKTVDELHLIFESRSSSTAPYNPRCNGLTEKMNSTLGTILRSYCYKSQETWDEWINLAVFCYNTSPQTSTKHSPFELVYGRKARFNLDNIARKNVPSFYVTDLDNFNNQLKLRLYSLWQDAADNLKVAQENQRKFQKPRDIEINAGDYVLVRYKHFPEGSSAKLFAKYHGPYKVTEVKYPDIVIASDKGPYTINVQMIRRYTGITAVETVDD